jgi:Uma2 family endonuclease
MEERAMPSIEAPGAAELAELGFEWPPTQEELPYSDGKPMESQRHYLQLRMLFETLERHWAGRPDGYVGANMFLHYSLEQVRNKDFLGPDFFAVLGVPRHERKSWVVWEEGKGPDLVIELLSASTTSLDKGKKKRIYRDSLRVPEYYWYDPMSGELAGFALKNLRYQPIEPGEDGRLWSEALGLSLVRWQGRYYQVEAPWLRFALPDGTLVPTTDEAAEQERERAEQERERAEQERERAEQERERAEQEHERAEQEHEEASRLKALLARYQERFGELP